jgi:hypothetical protein
VSEPKRWFGSLDLDFDLATSTRADRRNRGSCEIAVSSCLVNVQVHVEVQVCVWNGQPAKFAMEAS